jgi:hypothetical protein
MHVFVESYVQVAERPLMKHILLILCLVSEIFSQGHKATTLSPVSQRIKDAYNILMAGPNSKQLQKFYLETLPTDYETFERVFDSIADSLPNDVCHKLISLSKDGEKYLIKSAFIADAPNYLKHITITFATRFPKLFVDSIKMLSLPQRDSIATFLADVENHEAYHEYKTFIKYLKEKKESKLLELFLHAKQKRMKYKHHGE